MFAFQDDYCRGKTWARKIEIKLPGRMVVPNREFMLETDEAGFQSTYMLIQTALSAHS